MNVLHILTGGNIGGIEVLLKNYCEHSENKNYVLFLFEKGVIVEEIKNAVAICLNSNSKKIITIVRSMLKIVDQEDIQTILIHHASPVSYICTMLLKSIRPRIRVIIYAHGNAVNMCRISQKRGYKLRKQILALALRKATGVLAISESVKNSLINQVNADKDKISVIYNGVDIEHYECTTKKIGKEIKILFVGRLIEEKGVQNIIRLLSSLKEEKDFQFSVVGDGPYKNNLITIANEYGIKESVRFLGSRRDIPKLLSKADIFMHIPDWEEGFGITIIEAMAAGKICICNCSGAIPEIIQNGVNGFLIDSANPHDFKELIYKLCNDNDLVQKIQQNAIKRAKEFDIRTYCISVDNYLKKHEH